LRTVLVPGQSADLRDQMVAEIGLLSSADEAADWVHKNLPLKNTLVTDDADPAADHVFRDGKRFAELCARLAWRRG
jgi:hypothetical protein